MKSPPNKPRRKRSIIWSIDKATLEKAVIEAPTLNKLLLSLGLDNRPTSYRTMKARLQDDGIDYSHITLGLGHSKGKSYATERTSLKDVLVIGSTFSRTHLKKRLIKEGLLKNECYKCGILPEWNGEKLALQLDHVNGISDDNRLENLRLLCPNCHSQTDTFGGRKNKKEHPLTPSEIDPNWRNAPRLNTRRVVRPTKEELTTLLWDKPTTEIAKQFGVSDSAVGKWAKEYGIPKPPRGHWQKKLAA